MDTFEFIKQIVQYGWLTENRQYAYTSSETIIVKLKLCGSGHGKLKNIIIHNINYLNVYYIYYNFYY